jgi:hypothetical protein
MSEETSTSVKRIIEPFVYFPNHASAIAGLGGAHRSPDPNYCFHTHYFEYAPGRVLMHVTLLGAQACFGELSIRIHAYRPGNEALGIKMVGAHRENLAGLSGDHRIAVKFAAIPGVHYAAYGFFTEASDITASGIDLIAEEFGNDDAGNYREADAPQTILVAHALEETTSLISAQAPTLQTPVSQICTKKQLDELDRWEPWSRAIAGDGNQLDRWRQIFPLRVLERYGFLRKEARCLLLEPVSHELGSVLSDAGCFVERVGISERTEDRISAHDIGYFDFAICTHPAAWVQDRAAATSFIDQLLQNILSGGFAILVFDYDPASGTAETKLTKGDIERAAFHLLGHSHNVAQLNFSSGIGRDAPSSPETAFAMVIQR